MHLTKVYEKNLQAWQGRHRLIANRGGTRSGKTYSLVSLFVTVANTARKARDIDIVSESLPHLKRGAINDIDEILTAEGLIEGVHFEKNKSDKTYKFQTGTVIRFFSADDWGKVKGSRRDVLFINECNRIKWETYRQLAVRTTECIFLDWNPDSEFWFEEKGLRDKVGTVEIHSTYLDNPFLSSQQIKEIESNRHDDNWWRVYGLGLTGRHEGLIYKNWEQVNELPKEFKKVWSGLDFGFTNDPTSLILVGLQGGELWIDEQIYEKGLTNPEIATKAKDAGAKGLQIVADSAEPKSIAELKTFGLMVEEAKKGADSILHGIGILQRYKWNVTSRSLNVIKELRNYKWKLDKLTGKPLNVPVDNWNHALDAIRYVALNKLDEAKPMRRRAPVGKLKD